MRKMIRTVLSICLLACFLLSLTGCADAAEIDDEVYTLAIGIDKGSGNNYMITIQYPVYKGGSQGTSGGGGGGGGVSKENGVVDGTVVQSVEAPSLLEAINLFNTSIGRRVSLMHCKIIVFSEEIAREGVSKYIAPITRYRETRRIMRVVVSRTNARELISNMKSLIGDSVPKGLELFFSQSGNNALFNDVTLHEFYKDLTIGYEQPYAVYAALNPLDGTGAQEAHENAGLENSPEYLAGELKRKGGGSVEFLGMAVFKGDRMTGVLDGHDVRFFSMVTGDFIRAEITLEDVNKKNHIIVFDTRLSRRPVIKLSFQDGKPIIHVILNIETDISSIQSRIQYEGMEKIKSLDAMLQQYLIKGISAMIQRTQKEFDSDIIGFGRKAAAYFPTIQDWEKYNWLDHYREASVSVDVDVNVRRTGLIYEAVPLK